MASISATGVEFTTTGDVVVNAVENVALKSPTMETLKALRKSPDITTIKIAVKLSLNQRTVQCHIKTPRDQDRIIRAGSDKSGF
jgi:hypothetical protein